MSYFNDGAAPFFSVLQQLAAVSAPSPAVAVGSSAVAAGAATSVEEAAEIHAVCDTFKQLVNAELEKEQAAKRMEAAAAAAAAGSSGGGRKPVSDEQRTMLRELTHEEAAEAELAREREDRQQRLDRLPKLEIKRFSLGLGAPPPVSSELGKENNDADAGVGSGALPGQHQKSCAVGTADDPFRAKLAEMAKTRECLLAHQSRAHDDERKAMVDELEMLKQSLNVLRIMVASQQQQQQPPTASVPPLPHFVPVSSPKKTSPSAAAAATTAEGVPRCKYDYFNTKRA